MDVIIVGGFIRMVQGLLAAAPTLIIGLFIASLFRYYLRAEGTQKLFGNESLLSLPQSWAVGMLLPVCSIGVIPIVCEMRRQGVRPGAITAFALAAPLFNPLSLLYGLTLSRPMVIIGFAIGSLLIVTLLGLLWDRARPREETSQPHDIGVLGLQRLAACFVFMARELIGTTGFYALIAGVGLLLLGAILPHGSLQGEVEQLDPLAPAKMAVVSVFIYATPILTMSQLGMMFDHGNSPGAAFTLLLLGTGVNLGTLYWIQANFGFKQASIWFIILLVSVLGIAYTVERPLIPPGIEPAGHSHAFDIYTNPLHRNEVVTFSRVRQILEDKVGLFEWVGGGIVLLLASAGLLSVVLRKRIDLLLEPPQEQIPVEEKVGLDRHVSPRTVGLTCLSGLVAFSIVCCYAFYPKPSECLEEMRLARTEVLSGAASRDYERALRWIPILEGWTRKLEVGYAIRHFELRPYQQMQAFLLRKKLEELEHAVEHAKEFSESAEQDSDAAQHLKEEEAEIVELRFDITSTAFRLKRAFESANASGT